LGSSRLGYLWGLGGNGYRWKRGPLVKDIIEEGGKLGVGDNILP